MFHYSGPRPDHPRAGGEHGRFASIHYATPGSSPRWRGTRGAPVRSSDFYRIIPALAGNTYRFLWGPVITTDHPRAGGEHYAPVARVEHPTGSSPRWRGTPCRIIAYPYVRRIIPALAGNTSALAVRQHRLSDHPRAGGEHSFLATPNCNQCGSSPRWRGTLAGCSKGTGL